MDFKIRSDGVLIDYDRTQKILKIPKEVDGIKVKKFKEELFRGNWTIEEIFIPSTVTKLNDFEFSRYSSLKKSNF